MSDVSPPSPRVWLASSITGGAGGQSQFSALLELEPKPTFAMVAAYVRLLTQSGCRFRAVMTTSLRVGHIAHDLPTTVFLSAE